MLAVQGVLLFLFIPFVLFLLLRQPAGPGWSVLIGLAIMFGHRFLAVPWMAKFADVRCLWCGRVGAGRPLPVVSGGREWQMTACSDSHVTLIAKFLGFAFRFRVPIAFGIFVPLAWLVLASLASSAGLPMLPHDTNALVFRVVVAATVVAASMAPFLRMSSASPGGNLAVPEAPLRCPFPLHNLFLLGIGNVLWVFRVVGAWWLIDGLVRLVR
jgi:hypothetical protein